MSLKISSEVKNALLDSISKLSPIKSIDGKNYLSITKMELSKKGFTLLHNDLPIFQFHTAFDPEREVFIVTDLDALFRITLD